MGDLVALPEKDSGERPRTRTIHVFAWSAVPSGVLGDLLTTYYRTFAGTSAHPPHIARWPRAQLEETAHQLFPESRSRELSGRFARVLADAWLSSASDMLTELTVLVRGRLKGRHRVRALSATTRNQKLKLVRSRLQDRRVQDALIRGFHRSYTIDEVRELPPRAETVLRRPVRLRGAGIKRVTAFDHQIDARAKLDEVLAGDHEHGAAALIVLPTGAGKTVVALDWLFDRMRDSEDVRVLWIVHQRALVDQAIKEAEQVSLARNPEFSRTARAIHSGASEAAVLAADDTDFAAITWQTLGGTNSAYLKHWFKRPCYLVVDETHHVGAPDWDRLLRRCRRYRNVRGVIGLTATPNPVSAVKLSRRQRHFPTISYQKTLLDLIEAGILAPPRVPSGANAGLARARPESGERTHPGLRGARRGLIQTRHRGGAKPTDR